MPRHFLRFICAFVLSAALNSCAQELSQNEYVACIRGVRRELERLNPPASTFIIEHSKDSKTPEEFSKKVREDIIGATRRACDSVGVSYGAFNKTHEIYGRLKLSYDQEIKEYIEGVLKDYEIGRVGKWLSDEDRERIANLEFDLGLDDRLLLDVDKDGTVLLDGIETTPDSILSAAGDYWGRVHIRLDPDAEERVFFDLVGSLPEELFEPRVPEDSEPTLDLEGSKPPIQAQITLDNELNTEPTELTKVYNINISEHLSNRLYVRVRVGGLSSYEIENIGDDITVTLLIDAKGEVILNNTPVDSSNLPPLVEALLERSNSRVVILAADEDVKHGYVVGVARIAADADARSIHFMRRSEFDKLGLRINTEQILRKAPSEIRMK